MAEIIFRGPKRSDIPFLTHSWLRSYKGSPAVRGCDKSLYYHMHHKLLETLLSRGSVAILCYDDDEDTILSWACVEMFDNSLILHYVYTKQPFRRMGLAKKLLKKLMDAEEPEHTFYTHKTASLFPLEDRLNEQGIHFHPYMLWLTLPAGWEK